MGQWVRRIIIIVLVIIIYVIIPQLGFASGAPTSFVQRISHLSAGSAWQFAPELGFLGRVLGARVPRWPRSAGSFRFALDFA